MLLFNFVNYVFLLLCYVFLLLCMFRSVYSVSLCRSVYCWCVNVYCTVLLPPVVNPTAVNKIYINLSCATILAPNLTENTWPLPETEPGPPRLRKQAA
jgi:hypothetical protein